MKLEVSLPCSQQPVAAPTLRQINPLHTLPSYFLNIGFNIILPPTPIFSSSVSIVPAYKLYNRG
jgi:hypothetical protein